VVTQPTSASGDQWWHAKFSDPGDGHGRHWNLSWAIAPVETRTVIGVAQLSIKRVASAVGEGAMAVRLIHERRRLG
jgi:hypothetical protein